MFGHSNKAEKQCDAALKELNKSNLITAMYLFLHSFYWKSAVQKKRPLWNKWGFCEYLEMCLVSWWLKDDLEPKHVVRQACAQVCEPTSA